MQGFIDLTLLITLGAIAPSFLLGILVYLRGRSSQNKSIFILASFCLGLWSIVNYFSLQENNILFWIRLVLFFAILLMYIFYLLIEAFTEEKINFSKPKILLPGILSAVAMIATLSPLIFKSIKITDGVVTPIPGTLIPLFIITITTLFGLGGFELIKNINRSSSDKKARLMYVAIGYFTMFTLLILTQFIFVAFFEITFFVKFGPIFTLPFLVLSTLAILRHHLFNIRVIATELFTSLIILTTFLNFLFSESRGEFINQGIIFFSVTIFGVLLIRGTLREIKSLQELSDAKSEFVSIASHQLRTPLSIVKGFISLLKEGSFGSVTPKQTEILNKVFTTNEGMIRLVNDLLDVSRAEQGKLTYKFEKIDISDIIDAVAGDLTPSAKERNLTISWERPTKAIYVDADTDKIRNVIMNLLDNAIKYTEIGGISINVSQEGTSSDSVTIYMKDSGIGIGKDETENIFERFRRAEGGERVNATGTGLGLYIAKRIIEDHGGKITAESEGRGKGSTFIIQLPSYRDEGEQEKSTNRKSVV